MFKQHFTVVIIPQKTSKVRKIHVPTRLFMGFLVLVCLLVGGGFYMAYDYQRLMQLFAGEDLKTLDQQYSSQQELLDQYADAWGQVSQNVELLEELHEKLKKLTAPEIKSIAAKTKLIKPQNNQSILDWIDTEESSQGGNLDSAARVNGLLDYFETAESPLSQIPSDWPVRGILLSSFGSQLNPFAPQDEVEGIVIGTLPKAVVKAPADGIVVAIQPDPVNGQQVQIYHIYDLMTQYNRLSQVNLKMGEKVEKGQAIGIVGNQGSINAPHLVYKVYLNHIPQNPVDYVQQKSQIQYP